MGIRLERLNATSHANQFLQPSMMGFPGLRIADNVLFAG
jgi:hypothetical protein